MLWNDLSNAKLFTEMFRNKICWVKDYGGWFIYNEKIWERDNNDRILQYAVEVYEQLKRDLQTFDDNSDAINQKIFERHVRRSGDSSRLQAMVECAKAFLGESLIKFDAKPGLLNCNNGTIDLETMIFRSFDHSDFQTKISSVDYIPDAVCPLWEKFLNDIFFSDVEMINFIQRTVGYSLTTSITEHCMFLFYGFGSNGKTTFITTIEKILGDYSTSIPVDSLTKKKYGGIPSDIARLKGARVVTASEGEDNVCLDESLIKQLTGGDRVTTRLMYKDWFDFYPTFKIFLYTNKLPNIRGTDNGIWRRMRKIEFNLNLKENEKDVDLPKKLKHELPGILCWALEGYKEWKRIGLAPPKSVLIATEEYRNEEDDLGHFIEDHYIIEKGSFVTVENFKQHFKLVNGYYKSQKSIAEYMQRRGYRPKDNRVTLPNGDQIRAYIGIRVKDRHTTIDEKFGA